MTYPKDAVKHVSVAGNVDKILESSDLVIYGSFLEEQSFPEILMKAMALGKPIVAPDLLNIKRHVCSFFTLLVSPWRCVVALLAY